MPEMGDSKGTPAEKEKRRPKTPFLTIELSYSLPPNSSRAAWKPLFAAGTPA